MGQVTSFLNEGTIEEIDDRRHATTSRSQWLREAAHARLHAEDTGEWEAPPEWPADQDDD